MGTNRHPRGSHKLYADTDSIDESLSDPKSIVDTEYYDLLHGIKLDNFHIFQKQALDAIRKQAMNDDDAIACYHYAYLLKEPHLSFQPGHYDDLTDTKISEAQIKKESDEITRPLIKDHLDKAIDYFIQQHMQTTPAKSDYKMPQKTVNFARIEKAANDKPPHAKAAFYCTYVALKETKLPPEQKSIVDNSKQFFVNKTWWSSLSRGEKFFWGIAGILTLFTAPLLMSNAFNRERIAQSIELEKIKKGKITPPIERKNVPSSSSSMTTTAQKLSTDPSKFAAATHSAAPVTSGTSAALDKSPNTPAAAATHSSNAPPAKADSTLKHS